MSEVFTGTVEMVLHGGDGLVRHDKQSVFIPNTVAGDELSYRITDKKRGVLRGELSEIIQPSPHRVHPPCDVANTCGGCGLQAMNRDEQARLKSTWVTDAFQAFIQPHTLITPLTAHHDSFAGRRRVRWFFENGKLGFRKRYSHDLVHSQTCVALTSNLDALRSQLETLNLPALIQSVQAVELSNGTHIILESEQAYPQDINLNFTQGQQWWWRQLGTPSIKALNKTVRLLFDNIDLNPLKNKNLDIEIGPLDFIQGHQQGNQTLISQILAWSEGSKRVVDLFSGCGNLSLPIAAAFGATVMGAELNDASVKAANKNAKRLGLDAEYQSLDLFGNFPKEAFIGADTLILDPPRKGAQRICQHIQSFFPQQIIMVNCDVAAGARDAKALSQAGFQLKSLRPLDLFPYAGHVESLSLWTR